MKTNEAKEATINFSNLGGYSAGKYKVSKGLSEDGAAFTANILLNGKIVGSVSNHGQGGCNAYYFKSREEENNFLETAKVLYPGLEGDGSLVDELLVRDQMQNELVKKARRDFPHVIFPVFVLFRSGVNYINKDDYFFLDKKFCRFKTLDAARQKINDAKPDEYVIYISETQTFEAVRHTPSAETIERLEKEESERLEQEQRRKNAWTKAAPLEKCPRFLVSENEDNAVRITDSETNKEIEVDKFTYNNGRKILIALFG